MGLIVAPNIMMFTRTKIVIVQKCVYKTECCYTASVVYNGVAVDVALSFQKSANFGWSANFMRYRQYPCRSILVNRALYSYHYSDHDYTLLIQYWFQAFSLLFIQKFLHWRQNVHYKETFAFVTKTLGTRSN